MSDPNCESVCMAAMAMADGYKPPLSPDEVRSHLAVCASCRLEVERLRAVMKLLDAQERRAHSVQVWGQVEGRLREKQVAGNRSFGWRPFFLMGLLLVGFKAIEFAPQWNVGMLFRLLPVLIAATVFGYIRENPFKINLELKLEGE